MSMPYHKELLRSSVSLCFREFFVFRNKAKGVMTLLCQFEKMIYPSGTGAADAASFMIALYRPCEKLKDSSGNTITQIKAVGYCLPTAGNMRYEMRGHWRKDPKYGIQYDVEGYEEQIIPTREGIIAYLSSGQIKGIGPKMAERKVYPSYKDGAECYLAEATASRGYLADKPSVSPREWAQTAAVGIALRNAGFGLQFAMAGDEFEDTATDELNANSAQAGGCTPHESSTVTPDSETEEEYTVEPTAPPQRELTFEEKVEQAMRVPCPITKYGGKTLGDVLQMDPKAIQWCATKFTGGEEIRNAAKLICEYAQQKASA